MTKTHNLYTFIYHQCSRLLSNLNCCPIARHAWCHCTYVKRQVRDQLLSSWETQEPDSIQRGLQYCSVSAEESLIMALSSSCEAAQRPAGQLPAATERLQLHECQTQRGSDACECSEKSPFNKHTSKGSSQLFINLGNFGVICLVLQISTVEISAFSPIQWD